MSNELTFKRAEGDVQDNSELKSSKGTLYLSLLQDTSNACKKSKPEHYVEGAEAGKFFLNVPKMVLGNSIDIIVLEFFKYVNEVNPNKEMDVYNRYTLKEALSKGVITNPEAWPGDWRTSEGNPLVLNYGYLVKVIGHEDQGIAQYSFKKGGIKDAERLNSLLDRTAEDGKPASTYMQVITLKAKSADNDKGSWFGLEPEWKGWVNQDQYTQALDTRKGMASIQDQLQVEDKSDKPKAEDQKVEY